MDTSVKTSHKIVYYALWATLGALWGMHANAQSVFLKYGPVAGIQKSTGSTYQNTAAVAADIVNLWTCSPTTLFMRGDGTCAAALSGTVTVPNGGTGQVTLAAHGVLLGEGTSAVGSVAAMAQDTLLQGRGASADPAAVTLPNCASPNALTYSTASHTFVCSTITSFATPTVKVGLTAVTGSSLNSMAADSAPALDQTITPTMTGDWLFTGSSTSGAVHVGTFASPVVSTTAIEHTIVNSVNSSGVANHQTQGFFTKNSDTATNAVNFGLEVANNVSGHELIVGNVSSTFSGAFWTGGPTGEQSFLSANTSPMCIGNGTHVTACFNTNNTIQGFGPVANALVDVTPDTGTFTATYTGFTTTVTCTAFWSRVGLQVILTFCPATGTSNATTFTMTGLPAAITPPTVGQNMELPQGEVQDATVTPANQPVEVGVIQTGQVIFRKNGTGSGWTASGTKGILGNINIAYTLH